MRTGFLPKCLRKTAEGIAGAEAWHEIFTYLA